MLSFSLFFNKNGVNAHTHCASQYHTLLKRGRYRQVLKKRFSTICVRIKMRTSTSADNHISYISTPPYLLKLQFCLHSTLLRHNTLNIIRFTSVYTLALCLHCHIHSYTHVQYQHYVPTRGICHDRATKRLCESGRAVRWTVIPIWHYRKSAPGYRYAPLSATAYTTPENKRLIMH